MHRNVKPANLLVDNDTCAVKVVGVGLARLEQPHDEFRTEDGHRGMGTLDYMVPEQMMDSTKVECRAAIPSLQDVRADIPIAWDVVFQRMVAKRPEDRFESMADVDSQLKYI